MEDVLGTQLEVSVELGVPSSSISKVLLGAIPEMRISLAACITVR